MPIKKVKPPKKPRNLPKIKIAKQSIFVLVIIFLLLASIFLFLQYRSAQDKLAGPTKDNEKYTKNLGKMILLPTNETPTIAKVKDVTEIKDQAFFTDSQNGDIVFFYTKAKKAFLYRPSTNMIINVQPLGDAKAR